MLQQSRHTAHHFANRYLLAFQRNILRRSKTRARATSRFFSQSRWLLACTRVLPFCEAVSFLRSLLVPSFLPLPCGVHVCVCVRADVAYTHVRDDDDDDTMTTRTHTYAGHVRASGAHAIRDSINKYAFSLICSERALRICGQRTISATRKSSAASVREIMLAASRLC